MRSLAAPAWCFLLLACAHRNNRDDGRLPAGVQAAPVAALRPFLPVDACAPRQADGEEDLPAELLLRANALSFALEVDYLRLSFLRPQEPALTFAERGERCHRATNPGACRMQIDKFVAQAEAEHAGCRADACPRLVYVIATREDQVLYYAGPERLRELLGSIDRPAEAWLMLMAAGHAGPYACEDAEDTGYRSTAGDYELRLRVTTKRCRPFERTEKIFRVDHAGKVELIVEKVIERDPERCFVAGRSSVNERHRTKRVDQDVVPPDMAVPHVPLVRARRSEVNGAAIAVRTGAW